MLPSFNPTYTPCAPKAGDEKDVLPNFLLQITEPVAVLMAYMVALNEVT